MLLLGFAIYVFGAGCVIALLGGDVGRFLDVGSLFLALIPPLAVLAATRNFMLFGTGFRAAMLPKEPMEEKARAQAAALFRLLSKATALAVGAGALIAFANALMRIPSHHYTGEAVAAALCAPLYGLLLIAGIYEPCVFLLKKRRAPGSLNKVG